MTGSLFLKELKKRRLAITVVLCVAAGWIPAVLLLSPRPPEDPLSFYAAFCLRPLLVLGSVGASVLFSFLFRGDWTSGAAEFLLAKPCSRTAVFLGKALSGLSVLAAVNAAVYLSGMASLTLLCGAEWSVGSFLALSLDAFLPMPAFAGAALLASLLFPRSRAPAAPAAVLTLACFLPDALSWADGPAASAASRPLALLRWADLDASLPGPFPLRTAAMVVIAAALFAASWAVYRRMDVPERSVP